MSNMSYCRFENTSNDLADCVEALGRIEAGEEEALTSEYEIRGGKKLVREAWKLVVSLAESYGVEVEDLDEEVIVDAFLEANSRGASKEGGSR